MARSAGQKSRVPFKTKICKVCGKEFLPAAEHMWRVGKQVVCSYSCMRKRKREIEEKKAKAKAERKAQRKAEKQAGGEKYAGSKTNAERAVKNCRND